MARWVRCWTVMQKGQGKEVEKFKRLRRTRTRALKNVTRVCLVKLGEGTRGRGGACNEPSEGKRNLARVRKMVGDAPLIQSDGRDKKVEKNVWGGGAGVPAASRERKGGVQF